MCTVCTTWQDTIIEKYILSEPVQIVINNRLYRRYFIKLSFSKYIYSYTNQNRTIPSNGGRGPPPKISFLGFLRSRSGHKFGTLGFSSSALFK